MAKKYWEGNYDINTDWGGDESTNNLPLPGSAVQKVVKDKLNELEDNKVGYIHENIEESKVYFSASEEDYNKGNIIGSVDSTPFYSMEIKTSEENKKIFLSNDTDKNFIWYFKTMNTVGGFLGESVTIEYEIKNETIGGAGEKFVTTMEAKPDSNNENYTEVVINLNQYLSNGHSKINVNVKGLTTKRENSFTAEIDIISLEMKDVTNFSNPFVENFELKVNVNCSNGQLYFLEYRFDNDVEFTTYINDILKGTGQYYTQTCNIMFKDKNGNDISDGRHVFEYRLFVNINNFIYTTDIQRIEFIKGSNVKFNEPQILIYSQYTDEKDENGKRKEISVAEDGNLVINRISQYVPYSIKYAIYNSNNGLTDIDFIEVVNGVDTIPVSNTVSNGVFEYYDIQALDNGQKTIKIYTKDDGVITNGSGRIIYLNVIKSDLSIDIFNTNLRIDFSSIGKSNDSADKNTWISNVKNGLFKNEAIFSDNFDWSQGWTNDGLVISNGSKIEFDYAPFPIFSDEKNRYYVGGTNAYAFEIEFMTQNVTDENAVVCNMIDESKGKCGLLITGSEIKFTTPEGNEVSSRFKEGEMNRAVIVIRPNTGLDKFKGLVELYMNGVLSNITTYTENEEFQIMGNNVTSKNLQFEGAEGADIVIKYIRAYNGSIDADSVVNNYILYRSDSKEMISLYNKNNVINDAGTITPESMIKLGNIPILIFIGRTEEDELASGDGNEDGYDGDLDKYLNGYKAGTIGANSENWYQTLENTTDKKKNIDMDVIYYNPLDKTKNFKFVKAYITPQGTSSMYYPKKNYRIYTQKNKDTRCFFSTEENILEYNDMINSKFGEDVYEGEGDNKILVKDGSSERSKWEKWRGTKNYKKRKYSFKKNAQPVKCWCLKADFAETSSSHNTGIARLWGETLKKAEVDLGTTPINVFKTTAQETIEKLYNGKENIMPDVRTTIDGFPIVVFGKKCYKDIDSNGNQQPFVFLGQYNFNNDKSTESVFGFCDIENETPITGFTGKNNETNEETNEAMTLDAMLNKYMTCVETLDNGNALANFKIIDSFDEEWDKAFEFRYPEIPEAPKGKDYDNGENDEQYKADYAEWENETLPYWKDTHLKPFKHFAKWLYDVKWCDVNGNILPGLSEEEAAERKARFATEKWDHLDVWKVAAYYIYLMRFGAVDQVVKNSMLTSEGPFAYNINGNKSGYWDTTDVTSPDYGKYYKWYYINYDNDTIMGVKNDGRLVYGPEINRKSMEGGEGNMTPIYAGSESTLWNNLEADEEFNKIVTIADQGISKTMPYSVAINMFDVEQVGKWCERIYNKDAEYKYISPYVGNWDYNNMEGEKDEDVEDFTNKLFMLQGSRTAHRRWWLSRRFNLFDGKWASGDFPSKYIEVKCNYGSIGDTFGGVAGANAYFGYKINNINWPGAEGGETFEYKANSNINWALQKIVNIGDPIAIYGAIDLLELNLMGISKNLTSVMFKFGSNSDNSNKLERFYLSIPDELLLQKISYKSYNDDEEGTANRKTSFEKIKIDYPSLKESDFEESGKYPTSNEEFDAEAIGSPEFYRIPSEDVDGNIVYTYFAKVSGGVRNYSCTNANIELGALTKLQEFKAAGYMGLTSLNLTNNIFITNVDARYSNINTVTFAEGARINKFYASNALTTLSFNSCNNITLNNIAINEETLLNNKGVNLNKISIIKSNGLNHDSINFKKFILDWMKGGVSFKKNRDLTLEDIKWENVTIDDIKTIINFASGADKPLRCRITGEISMGRNNLSQADIDLIEKFKSDLNDLAGVDISVKVRIPYPNIIINAPESIVAGQKNVKISSDIHSDNDSISNYNLQYRFVEEVPEGTEGAFRDNNTQKYYITNTDGILQNGRIKLNPIDGALITDETIIGEDTEVIVAAILTYQNNINRDMTHMIIKDPTYAISGIINGYPSLSEINTFEYKLALLSNKNDEPIGTVNVAWSISGSDEKDGLQYISQSAVSKDGKTLFITTNSTPNQDELYGYFKITAYVQNYEGSNYDNLNITKEVMILNEDIILTRVSNEVVMNAFAKTPWVANEDFMTKDEAKKITDIGELFKELKTDKEWSFDEFRFFTNANLTSLSASAFKDTKLTSIIIPDNINILGVSIFENCKSLKTVELSKNISIIPSKAFYNCSSLESLILPDSIQIINNYSFGGVGIEKILFTNNGNINNKSIYLSTESQLYSIKDNAFELEAWGITEGGKVNSTNILNEISLPKTLSVNDENGYNFLLSKNLTKINLPEDSEMIFEDNILYGDKFYSLVIRAINTGEIINEPSNIINSENIMPYAFYNCKSIKKISLGETLARYGLQKGVFFESNIEEVDLSNAKNLRMIDDYTFYNANRLHTIKFPVDGNLLALGGNIFVNNTLLKELVLPDTIITVRGRNRADDIMTSVYDGNYSYLIKNCGIESFKIPESLVKCGMYLISNCSDLKKFEYSKYFNINSTYALLSSCNNIEEIKLPLFSKNINEVSWFVCKDGIVISGPYSSENAAYMKKTDLEHTDNIINNYNPIYSVISKNINEDLIVNANFYAKGRITTFENCSNISKFTFDTEDNHKIMATEDEGISIVRVGKVDSTTGIISPCNKTLVKVSYNTNNYQIDNDVVEIESGAFAHCKYLTGITIPNTITKIGEGAFAYTSSLKNVNIPSGIIILPKELFYGSGIENIILPEGVEVIGGQAFYSSHLKNIALPNSLKTISEESFASTKLVTITLPLNLETIKELAFSECSELNKIEILSNKLNFIGKRAFIQCLKVSEIKIVTVNAPVLETSDEYYNGTDIYRFHPYGYYAGTFLGASVPKDVLKFLYVPFNSSGYDSEKWVTPLLRTEDGYCGFNKTYLQLDENVIVRGDILNNYSIVYLKRESDNSIESVAVTNSKLTWNLKNQAGEVVTEVFDNEIIRLYSDSACTNEIGRFIACYKQTEYDLGSSQVLGSSNISLFNSNLFIDETETNKQNVEMANITKEEYEVLQAKINQLMKLLDKK